MSIGIGIGLGKIQDAGFDTSAAAYFTAAGITDSTEQNAANDLIVGLKDNNLFSKIIGLYLISPTSLAAAEVNAKTPGVFDITWVNTPAHTTTGVDFDGTQYGRTGILMSVSPLSINNGHLGYYSRDSGSLIRIDMGARESIANRKSTMLLNQLGDFTGAISGNQLVIGAANGEGNYILTRVDSSNIRGFKDGSLIANVGDVAMGAPAFEVYIGAQNNQDTADFFGLRECAFASIGESLSNAEVATYNTLVQTYQTNVIAGGREI